MLTRLPNQLQPKPGGKMDIKGLLAEHDKQNEVYLSQKAEIVEDLDITNLTWLGIAEERIDSLLQSLSVITNADLLNHESYVEAVDGLVSLFDDVVLECALIVKRREVVEEKILTLVKVAIAKVTDENARDRTQEHIVASLIDGLVLTEVPLVLRSSTITAALLHDTNPLRLGITFYRIFCDKYPEQSDNAARKYIDSEEEARTFMLTGNSNEATAIIAELFNSPIKTPEKYLLLSMSSFFSGLNEDAIRAIEMGIEVFPTCSRLINAKTALTA